MIYKLTLAHIRHVYYAQKPIDKLWSTHALTISITKLEVYKAVTGFYQIMKKDDALFNHDITAINDILLIWRFETLTLTE